MDVYTLLKRWVFLRLSPGWLSDNRPTESEAGSSHSDPCSAWAKSLASAAELHLADLLAGSSSDRADDETLLERDVGKPFARVFRRLRIQHIVNDNNSLNILEKVGANGRYRRRAAGWWGLLALGLLSKLGCFRFLTVGLM